MKNVKIMTTAGVLIGGTHTPKWEIVEVDESVAGLIVGQGKAHFVNNEAEARKIAAAGKKRDEAAAAELAEATGFGKPATTKKSGGD